VLRQTEVSAVNVNVEVEVEVEVEDLACVAARAVGGP
jgi:hypothetical protein